MVLKARLEKAFATVGAIAAIATVCFQLYLFINDSPKGIGVVLIRFFSYFTILSNIAVSICFFAIAFTKQNQLQFWKLNTTKTAILVYILVVAIVYNAVLRSLWVPTGDQKLVDEMLHVVMPLLFLMYWWLFSQKKAFNRRYVTNSLLFPFINLVWVLIYGTFSNWYPYPFVDAFNHGYPKAAISSVVLLGVFGLLSLLFFRWLSVKNEVRL
jgi:hypothetical protein